MPVPYAILVVFLLVLLYAGSFALNRRYMHARDTEGQYDMKKCLACPISVCGVKDRFKEGEEA